MLAHEIAVLRHWAARRDKPRCRNADSLRDDVRSASRFGAGWHRPDRAKPGEVRDGNDDRGPATHGAR